MSLRRSVQHVVTVAAHTDVQLLHSAAVVDFLRQIRALLDDEQVGAAAVLWNSVVEIVHIPVPEQPVREFQALPAMRRITCSEVGCAQCEQQRGGFRFPWLGVWTRRFAVVQPGVSPQEAWMALGNNTETMDRLVVESLAFAQVLGRTLFHRTVLEQLSSSTNSPSWPLEQLVWGPWLALSKGHFMSDVRFTSLQCCGETSWLSGTPTHSKQFSPTVRSQDRNEYQPCPSQPNT